MKMFTPLSRRGLRVIAAVGCAALFVPVVASCATDSGPASDREIGTTMEQLVELAQKEGEVHLIGYPDDWANYGELIAAFEEKYDIDVRVSGVDASSAEELQTLESLKGQPTLPDVSDIGYSFTTPAKTKNLLDHYVPLVADEIPDQLKDPEGYWVGSYYGVISFGVNADLVDVPKTFADLLDPQYKGKIWLGDPRQDGNMFGAVFAASLANGGSAADIEPGIDFFAELAEGGYFGQAPSSVAGMQTGEIAVILDWNYNFPGMEEELTESGVDLQVVVPEDGVYGNYYAQPISVDSPHPNAARLWLEWMLSDEGASYIAKSGAVPARLASIVERTAISEEILANLPDAALLEEVKFPTIEQGDAAAQLIIKQWGPRVASISANG